MSRSGAMDRIDALLGGITDPAFVSVLRGEPLAISGTPVLAFWFSTRDTVSETLTDTTSSVSFTIRAYFRMQSSQDVRESIELAMWNASYEIDRVLRSDANLAGHVSDSSVGPSQAGFTDIGGVAYRTLDVTFRVEILGDVTITP